MRTLLASLLLVGACAPAAMPVVTDADRTAIREHHAEFMRAMNAGDMATVAGLYTDDAVLLPPNAGRVTGRAGIEAFFRTFPPVGDLVLGGEEHAGGGDLVVVNGTYSLNLMPPGATVAVADTGKYIEVWRRQADGTLKIATDMWNSNLPLPMPPATP